MCGTDMAPRSVACRIVGRTRQLRIPPRTAIEILQQPSGLLGITLLPLNAPHVPPALGCPICTLMYSVATATNPTTCSIATHPNTLVAATTRTFAHHPDGPWQYNSASLTRSHLLCRLAQSPFCGWLAEMLSTCGSPVQIAGAECATIRPFQRSVLCPAHASCSARGCLK